MKTFITFILALFCVTAHAEFFSGNDVYELHSTNEKGFLYYTAGVFDSGHNAYHCAPSNVTTGQVADMFYQFLRDNPNVRSFTAESIARSLFKTTWPCPAKRGSGA
jgi:hypothetical protein